MLGRLLGVAKDGHLRDQEMIAGDLLLQLSVLLGVAGPKRRTDHGNGMPAARDRGTVGGRIDAPGEAGDDGAAAVDEFAGEALGPADAVEIGRASRRERVCRYG